MRIGIVVNPDAGLGGRLGFKGSDGRAKEAREAGAVDRSGPRMQQCISKFLDLQQSSLNRMGVDPTFVAWTGRMGGDWLDGVDYEQRQPSPSESTADDTAALVLDLVQPMLMPFSTPAVMGQPETSSMLLMVMKRH